MSALLYPVAETAEAALHAPRGHAVREREAGAMAAAKVAFVTELVGPAFPTREAALQAYAAVGAGDEAERRWREPTPVSAATGRAPLPPAQPIYRDGRRWPEPEPAAPILWRLAVSYWRIGGEPAAAGARPQAGETYEPAQAARTSRRRAEGRELLPAALNALARQPLRPVRPQQPLDVGLFEVRPPEAPDTLIPDE